MHAKELVLHNHLSFYRRLRRYTQKELGNMVGRTARTISHIEQGFTCPPLELAYRLAKVFNVPVTELFFEKGQEPVLKVVREKKEG